MQRQFNRLLDTVLALSSLAAAPAQAHHSGTVFDFMNCRDIQGAVHALQWVYPHCWLWVDVINGDGSTATRGFEFPSPTQLEHIDALWPKTVVNKGDHVSVQVGPLKDGRTGGAMARITLADGRMLIGSPGLCGGEPNPAAGTRGAHRPKALRRRPLDLTSAGPRMQLSC